MQSNDASKKQKAKKAKGCKNIQKVVISPLHIRKKCG
jgi:hypothetical protein